MKQSIPIDPVGTALLLHQLYPKSAASSALKDARCQLEKGNVKFAAQLAAVAANLVVLESLSTP